MKETNEILREINENLKGIRNELNYMNGVEVLKDGTKISRDMVSKVAKTPLFKGASR